MQIQSAVTGVTEIKDLQIQKSVSQIVIVKTGAAAITDEFVTLSLVAGGTSKTVVPLTKARRLAVIAQFGNGYQLVNKRGAGDFKSAYFINLNPDPNIAVELMNDAYLSLDLTNLVAGSTYSVFCMEKPQSNRSYIQYGSYPIPSGDPSSKDFTPEKGAYQLGITNNGGLSSVRLSYVNGKEITLVPEELDMLMRQNNDIAFMPDNLTIDPAAGEIETIAGAGTEMYLVGLGGVRAYTVVTNGTQDVTLVTLTRKGF